MTDTSPPDANPLTVLVLTRAPDLRQRLLEALASQRVTVADTCAQGMELAARGGFDVAVLHCPDPSDPVPLATLMESAPLLALVAVADHAHDLPALLSQGAQEVLVWGEVEEDALLRAMRQARLRQESSRSQRLRAALLGKAFEQSPLGLALVGLNHRIQMANPEIARVVGVPRDHLTSLWLDDLFEEGDRPAIQDEMGRMLMGELESALAEQACLRPDGSPLWVRRSMRLLRDEQDRPLSFLVILEDIDHAKRMEAQLKQTLRELEIVFENSLVGIFQLQGGRVIARCNRRGAEIFGYTPEELAGQSVALLHLSQERFEEAGQTLYQQLATREIIQAELLMRHRSGASRWIQLWGKAVSPPDLRKGVIWMADDITDRRRSEELRRDMERITQHDLKMPLNALLNLPELVRLSGGVAPEQEEHLRHMEDSARQMLDMITRSLDLVRIEQGLYQYAPVDVDLAACLRRVLREQQSLAQTCQVRLEARVDGLPLEEATLWTRSDMLLCHSIFGNLLRNAIEASPVGGTVRLTVETDRGCVVTVHNQGVAPAEIRDRFFEKYVSHGKSHGLGLGTYAVKLMTEVQGGRVSLTSCEEKGTTITVRLRECGRGKGS